MSKRSSEHTIPGLYLAMEELEDRVLDSLHKYLPEDRKDATRVASVLADEMEALANDARYSDARKVMILHRSVTAAVLQMTFLCLGRLMDMTLPEVAAYIRDHHAGAAGERS